jgi:DNA-binding transcriptional LysR family regulator
MAEDAAFEIAERLLAKAERVLDAIIEERRQVAQMTWRARRLELVVIATPPQADEAPASPTPPGESAG